MPNLYDPVPSEDCGGGPHKWQGSGRLQQWIWISDNTLGSVAKQC